MLAVENPIDQVTKQARALSTVTLEGAARGVMDAAIEHGDYELEVLSYRLSELGGKQTQGVQALIRGENEKACDLLHEVLHSGYPPKETIDSCLVLAKKGYGTESLIQYTSSTEAVERFGKELIDTIRAHTKNLHDAKYEPQFEDGTKYARTTTSDLVDATPINRDAARVAPKSRQEKTPGSVRVTADDVIITPPGRVRKNTAA